MSDPGTAFAERYRAMSARDSRFDGQFITGVLSTGIYCRPSCPAVTPLERNVRFFRTAAAAHDAGLRACKRCQPDAVPGSPEWNLRDDLASRAMRLIADGIVEREGVPGLARRLGYTARHLTRVLSAELGAGPLALARAHRAQTARELLVSTSLPIADVAFASGFASVRQFNETMGQIYELTPTEIRRRWARRPVASDRGGSSAPASLDGDGGARGSGGGASLTLRLPARAPFDGAGLMRFFADHAIAGLESGDATGFARRLRLPNGTADIRVVLAGDDGLVCAARLDSVADVATLVARVRRLFDLDADSVAIDAALGADPHLGPLVREVPGIRIPGAADVDEQLVRTLVGQQISVAAARTVLGRLTAELGEDGCFPTAAAIAEHGRDVLRGPATRIASIIGVARALAEGALELDVGASSDELRERLVALPGVGPWTAGYVAMRALGNPDVLLTTDLVILQSAGRRGLPSSTRPLAAHGERWAPWRSYAGLHLWRARHS